MTLTTTRTNLAATVDQLGRIKAAISDLTEDADASKAVIIVAAAETGERAFEGDLFRATVSFADKRVTDYRAILAELIDDGSFELKDRINRLVKKHTQVAEGVPTVRVSARKA